MVRRTTRTLVVAFALFAIAGAARAQDRAQQVLSQARQAIGSEDALQKVTTLAAKASVKSAMKQLGNMQIASDVDVEFILPDKYRKTQAMSIGGMSFEIMMGCNGERLLYDDGGRAAAAGIDPTSGPMAAETLRNLKQDAFRLQTLWLLSLPRNLSFAVTYAGEAEAPDGKADVLDVKGPDKFALRMFLDKETHHLLMATFTQETPDIDMQKLQEAAKGAAGDKAAMQQVMQDYIAKAPRKSVPVEMRFSDYKKADGVLFPHHMTVDMQGQGQEEWTLSSFKLNPPLKPERFEKK